MAGSFKSIFRGKPEDKLTIPDGDKPLMRVLEPRVLLDAAAVETALDIAGQAAHSQLADDYIANARAADSIEGTVERDPIENAPPMADDSLAGEAYAKDVTLEPHRADREIVFIDAGVDDRDTLIASLEPGVTIHILESGSDGVEQMARILADAEDYSAIHIFSHGVAGSLQLGDSQLDAESISGKHAEALKTIGEALSESGDILIYGCDFGQGEDGKIAAGRVQE